VVRWFFRLAGLLVVGPTACLFTFVFLFTSLAFVAVPQLPPWAQAPVMAWLLGGSGETEDGAGVYPGPVPVIPPEGYAGPESFLCILPPEIGYLTDKYGVVRSGGWIHYGIDYGTYYQEVPVRTPFGGMVVYADWAGPFGLLVIIENAGYRVYLAHHSALIAAAGDLVSAGEVVGISGTTGNSSGIHVHFEVRVWDGDSWMPVDPNLVLLPGQAADCEWYGLAAAP
jgi:murein DD-endopeptidase MepM/ murein hydrolase activator NlpD